EPGRTYLGDLGGQFPAGAVIVWGGLQLVLWATGDGSQPRQGMSRARGGSKHLVFRRRNIRVLRGAPGHEARARPRRRDCLGGLGVSSSWIREFLLSTPSLLLLRPPRYLRMAFDSACAKPMSIR